MHIKHIKTWVIFLIGLMPSLVWASQIIDNKFGQDDLINDRFVIGMIAIFSLVGSIGSIFIKTDADEFIKYPNLAKIFIGFFLGIAVGLGIYKYYGLSIYLLLAPVFVIASLGSAILVFYMRYLSDPKMKSKLTKKIDEKLGLSEDESEAEKK
ncbi:MAG: hypothetical protein [Bacteriophage sp.]|nr:MAG: hypothetical protein [Bacteriophage sp.]